MTPELTVLTLAALLQVVTFVAYAIPANREVGPGYTMSARDREPSKALSDRTARLGRAFNNMFEALALSAILAWIFLAARVAYVPAYALGLRPGRSLIWAVGLSATVLMLLAALF